MPSDTPDRTPNSGLLSVFTNHPSSVGETYLQHMGVAFRFGCLLSVAAGAAFIHALIPAACERTASNMIRKLHAEMEKRH